MKNLSLKNRLILTGLITMLIWASLAWDFFHDGVPTHYILQRQDLPGLSNWWGGIFLPLFTWILLVRIKRRLNQNDNLNIPSYTIYRFLGGLIFGIALSVFFTLGSEVPLYMMIAILFLSLFIPLFYSEYVLGYVLGMTYTFGGNLPIFIVLVLTVLFLINYKIIRFGILHMVSIIKK